MAHQNLNDIHTIVVHCSATEENMDFDAEDIRRWHTAPKPEGRGWSDIGYHGVILLDGSWEPGRPFTRRGAHVAGNNMNTLGFVLIGGLAAQTRKPKNTFNYDQFNMLQRQIFEAKKKCINIKHVRGHRSYSPDLNGDGIITPNEWIKQCPCFSVSQFMEKRRIVL